MTPTPYRPRPFHRDPAQWAAWLSSLPVAMRLFLSLVTMVLLGAVLFMLPGISTRPLTFNEALFTSASALTVTGLSVIIPGTDLTFAGQVLLLVLIQIGGIGLMIFTVVIFRLLGRQITLVDRMALRDIMGSLQTIAIVRLTARVLVAVVILQSVGAVLLWLQWRDLMVPDDAVWFAIFHSISALCNSGFDLFGGLPGYATIPNESGVLAIVGGLVFIGSLGVPVIADLLALPNTRRLSLHSRLTLSFVAFLMLISTLTLFVSESMHPGGLIAHEPFGRQVGIALFQSISARTAGFVGMESFENLAASSQMVLITVMFIGAAPASMGGGITTGTAVVLTLALWSYVRNRPYPEIGGRMITTVTVRRATAVLTISLVVVVVATLLLLITDPTLTLDGAIFEVVSAFATCGLSLAYTPKLNLVGQLVIILVMMWGRLGALTVMIALTRPAKQPLYYFPEEPIMIG
jgi:trk system potassium uptake protein TrkH